VNNKREKIPVKEDILHNNLVTGDYLSNIKIGDLLTDTDNFKNIRDVRLIVRYEMQDQQYDRLKTCVLDSLKLNKKFMNTDFLRRFKKGSRQFRKIFDCFADSQFKKIEELQRSLI
jgi:methyl coenzyme M reductase subunit D